MKCGIQVTGELEPLTRVILYSSHSVCCGALVSSMSTIVELVLWKFDQMQMLYHSEHAVENLGHTEEVNNIGQVLQVHTRTVFLITT